LIYARQDRERDELTDEDEHFIVQTTREILDDVAEHLEEKSDEQRGAGEAERSPRVRLLACPARDELDQVAVEMLQQMLDPKRWEIHVTGVMTLASELVARAEELDPAVVCIGSLPPGGMAHTRYLCKRLRARFPEIKIVVGRWGLRAGLEENKAKLQAAGADHVEDSLLSTRQHFRAWLPALAEESAPAGRELQAALG
jgi:hypothetical protein